MTRIPLATDIKTRTLAPDKGAKLKNCYVEIKGDQQSTGVQTFVRKRPAAQGGYPVVTAIAQGAIGSPNSLVVVNGDTLTAAINVNTTLTTQPTVLAFGTTTITLPTSPAPNQTVTISNLGSGIITVAPVGVSIHAGGIGWFIWDGFSWGYVYGAFCSNVTLPSTHDFGTVQYAGPSETPYSVPATTVSYTTIGITPCGGALRQIVTKTYSSRSVPLQWKTVQTASAVQYTGLSPGGYSSIGYGATTTDSINQSLVAALTDAPSTQTNITYLNSPPFDLSGKQLVSTDPTVNPNGISYSTQVPDYGSGGLTAYVLNRSQSQVTLYYLDVHEVWTYDII